MSADIKTQGDLARALGIRQSSVSGAKKRDAFPEKWGVKLANKYNLSLDLLLCGEPPRVALEHHELNNDYQNNGRLLDGERKLYEELLKTTRELLAAKDAENALLRNQLKCDENNESGNGGTDLGSFEFEKRNNSGRPQPVTRLP